MILLLTTQCLLAPADQAKVEALMSSIQDIGLQEPVSFTSSNSWVCLSQHIVTVTQSWMQWVVELNPSYFAAPVSGDPGDCKPCAWMSIEVSLQSTRSSNVTGDTAAVLLVCHAMPCHM